MAVCSYMHTHKNIIRTFDQVTIIHYYSLWVLIVLQIGPKKQTFVSSNIIL